MNVWRLFPSKAGLIARIKKEYKLYTYFAQKPARRFTKSDWICLLSTKNTRERLVYWDYQTVRDGFIERRVKDVRLEHEQASEMAKYEKGQSGYGFGVFDQNNLIKSSLRRQTERRINLPPKLVLDLQYLPQLPFNNFDRQVVTATEMIKNNFFNNRLFFPIKMINYDDSNTLVKRFVSKLMSRFRDQIHPLRVLPNNPYCNDQDTVYVTKHSNNTLSGTLTMKNIILPLSNDSPNSQKYAISNGIPSAHLPIKESFPIYDGSTTKLNLGIVHNILTDVYFTGGDWPLSVKANYRPNHLIPSEENVRPEFSEEIKKKRLKRIEDRQWIGVMIHETLRKREKLSKS
ncbi:unnamed protein product [Bursaphelenchus okinawaensis]|uniref:Uncharacterized protein n=1 Tax=Bursaphelenchus okinawaensis TaxID=465554 RepID=A0A811LMS1_9BILA|nr:unnamed protein product [Bursaphelenchus okinawaensis]CAG9125546.1 unnamed protein product [Bursaphelenchus okinawaensis]